MYSLYSAGDKEKRERGPIPLQEMLIRLFQPAPFKMYCYGPINCTPRGDIPQINDYLRISHAAVRRHMAGFAGRIIGAHMNTDDSSSQDRDPSSTSAGYKASGLSTCVWHLLGTPTTLQLVIMKERDSFAKSDKLENVFGYLKRS